MLNLLVLKDIEEAEAKSTASYIIARILGIFLAL